MTPATPLFPDGSSSAQLWYKYLPDEEVRILMDLTNDQRGLFTSLRLYAITHGGLPEDSQALWMKAKNFCAISRFKFFKLWPVLREYFVKIDEKLAFEHDERKVDESRSRVAKYRDYGKLGAQRRWESQPQTEQRAPIVTMAKPSAEPMATDQQQSREEIVDTEQQQQQGNSTVVAAAAASPEPPGGENTPAAAPETLAIIFTRSKSLIASKYPDITPKFMNQLVDKCRDVDRTLTDDTLCQAIREVYKGPDQKSAGLFMRTIPAWLANRAQGEICYGEVLEARRPPTKQEKIDEIDARILRRHGAIK